MLSEENLPELLRKALQAKREEDERNGMLSGESALFLMGAFPYGGLHSILVLGDEKLCLQGWSSGPEPCPNLALPVSAAILAFVCL